MQCNSKMLTFVADSATKHSIRYHT